MTKKKIILVDDNQTNLTACKKVLQDLYDVFPSPSAEKMFDILQHVIPDLILLDVEMPGLNGYDAMRKLKSNDDHKDIPVIFLSAMDDTKSEIEGLNLGAVDYIHKPLVSDLLIRRIETHMMLIESKKELSALNISIEKLLTKKENENELPSEAKEEALKELLIKNERISKMVNEIRPPLNTIIEMIETAIKADDIEKNRDYLLKADAETRLILEIVDDMTAILPS